MKERFGNILRLVENLDELYILYNGPECGTSVLDHTHFQVAGKEEELTDPFALNFSKSILENENGVTTYVNNVFTTYIGMTSGLRVDLMQQFEKVYQNLSVIHSDEEPLTSMITWYGLDKISHSGGDEVEVWSCVIFLHSKHRPDYYYTPNEKRLLISPAIAEVGGISLTVREEDMDKLDIRELAEICKEISLSLQQLSTLYDQLFKRKQ